MALQFRFQKLAEVLDIVVLVLMFNGNFPQFRDFVEARIFSRTDLLDQPVIEQLWETNIHVAAAFFDLFRDVDGYIPAILQRLKNQKIGGALNLHVFILIRHCASHPTSYFLQLLAVTNSCCNWFQPAVIINGWPIEYAGRIDAALSASSSLRKRLRRRVTARRRVGSPDGKSHDCGTHQSCAGLTMLNETASATEHADTRSPNRISTGERCPECRRQITVGPSGVEYGHERGAGEGVRDRCSRRPESVDPHRKGPDHDGWCGPGDSA